MNLFKFIFRKQINNLKGSLGEYKIGRVFPKEGDFNKAYHDINLYNENGDSVQIDYVYLCGNKVYVIEVKNYAGRIYGSANQQNWKQVLAYGKEKHDFYNPIKQNNAHIYHLNKYFKSKGINCEFENIVVFTPKAQLMFKDNNLYSFSLFKRYIKKWVKVESTDKHSDIRKVLDEMSELKINRKEHVNNIKERQDKLKDGICPRCGSLLVARDGKYGKFLGCSNYPKCKFIKK